jgi:hypothetical protein
MKLSYSDFLCSVRAVTRLPPRCVGSRMAAVDAACAGTIVIRMLATTSTPYTYAYIIYTSYQKSSARQIRAAECVDHVKNPVVCARRPPKRQRQSTS